MTEHTHDHGRGVLSQLAPEGRELKALIPGVYEGFAQLHTAAFAEGVLDKKTKELLALELLLQFVVMVALPATPVEQQ